MAISNVARLLGWPYVKVTRLRFVFDEFVEVTNLGGGAQDIGGWTLRSPRGTAFTFPAGTVLQPGGRCTVYTGPARNNPTGECLMRTPPPPPRDRPGGHWPDDAGEVVLFYDALNLLADDTFYSADPNNQPPPPNLQLVDIQQ